MQDKSLSITEDNEEFLDEQYADFTDEEYEYSLDISDDFLENQVLPMLEKWENDSDNEGYIPGIATVTLFMRLATILGDLGHSKEDLVDMIDNSLGTPIGENLH